MDDPVTVSDGLGKLRFLRDKVQTILANMERSANPRFDGLIDRGRSVLAELNRQIERLERMEGRELGFVWLVPALWAAGGVAGAYAAKWISDAFTETEKTKTYADLAAKYGPDKAVEMIKAQASGNASKSGPLTSLIWLAGIALTAFIMTRFFGRS